MTLRLDFTSRLNWCCTHTIEHRQYIGLGCQGGAGGEELAMLAAGGAVPVASCGPLVRSSACTLCVTDGLFVSTGCGTPSALPMHTCMYTHNPVSSHSTKEALSLLTNSDIVLHVSSELCLPTNIYSCHNSTVQVWLLYTLYVYGCVCKELYHLQHSCLIEPCSSFAILVLSCMLSSSRLFNG